MYYTLKFAQADELRNVADDDQPLELRFPLVLIADEQLSGEQRRQKRVQQMQSARVQKRRERDVVRAAEVCLSYLCCVLFMFL